MPGNMSMIKPMLILAFVFSSVVAWTLIRSAMTDADVAAFDSCLRSVHRELVDFASKSPMALEHSPEWRELDSSLRKGFENKTVFHDCSQLTGNELVDPWNHQVRIVHRQNPGEEPEFIVWSFGPDGEGHTNDDLFAPHGYGEKLVSMPDTAY
jgi:hypothetical protein